jgi:ABC-type xylose transport system permease subunit
LPFTSPAKAWLDCPYERINDPYPGQCGLYTDTNNNQICDHSEAPAKEAQSTLPSTSSKNFRSFFIFLEITVIILVVWFLTKKFLRPLNFRLFWNLFLLASFLPVGISGILLFLNIQIPNFGFWHNFLGVIFVIVGLLHLLARLNYFKQALGNKIKTN